MAHTEETRKRDLENRKLRRLAWLNENGPCRCGSRENLEVHHTDPALKKDHNVWSWSEDRRIAELAKCIPLCRECHKKETNEYVSKLFKVKPEDIKHGTYGAYHKHHCQCIPCRDFYKIWRRAKKVRTGW